MDELFQLVAVEGFYQVCRKTAMTRHLLLSREDFCKMRHNVDLDVDFMLLLFRYGYQLPKAIDITPPANGRAAPLYRN